MRLTRRGKIILWAIYFVIVCWGIHATREVNSETGCPTNQNGGWVSC